MAEADFGAGVEEAFADELEKGIGGFDGVGDEVGVFRVSVAGEESAFGAGVVEGFEEAVEAVGAEPEAEVVGGDGGDGVGFVEDEEIAGEEDAGRFEGVGHSGADEGEKEAVVDDDEVGALEGGFGALVMAVFGGAVAAVAGGGIGVDPFPDGAHGGGGEFLAEAGFGVVGPLDDALEFVLLGGGEEIAFGGDGLAEAGGAEVVGFSEKKGGAKIGAVLEAGNGGEQLAADREVAVEDLFLEGNGGGGDEERAFLSDGVDDAGEEVGEAFSDAGAGFEEERLGGLHAFGDGEGHFLLLGAVFEVEDLLEFAAGGEERFHLAAEVRRGGGGAVFVLEADHWVRTPGFERGRGFTTEALRTRSLGSEG